MNMQQLPHDEITRSCFVAEEGNMFVSCDYSAQEGRVQGDIYNDQAILKMYKEGIDGHSMYAKIFFKEELKDIDVHDVKKLRPDLRSKAKGPEFVKSIYYCHNYKYQNYEPYISNDVMKTE